MPEYRISYGLLYDFAAVSRAATVAYAEHPSNVGTVQNLDDVESNSVPEPFGVVSSTLVSQLSDSEAVLRNLVGGTGGFAQDVATGHEEHGVVFIDEDDVEAYIMALDDLVSRVSLDDDANSHLREAITNVVQQLSQPLHPTDGTVAMEISDFTALNDVLSQELLEIAFSEPALDD